MAVVIDNVASNCGLLESLATCALAPEFVNAAATESQIRVFPVNSTTIQPNPPSFPFQPFLSLQALMDFRSC